jgi:hypothetical protein
VAVNLDYFKVRFQSIRGGGGLRKTTKIITPVYPIAGTGTKFKSRVSQLLSRNSYPPYREFGSSNFEVEICGRTD